MVQGSWTEVQELTASQAKAQVLQILAQWPLFGSSFFSVSDADPPPAAAVSILFYSILFYSSILFLSLIHI